ncbi:unnamed protein product [Prunus brigantina]
MTCITCIRLRCLWRSWGAVYVSVLIVSGPHMKEYGMTESWTLLFSIEPEAVPWVNVHSFKPLVLSKNGEMVLLTYKYHNSVFFWYDLKKKSFKQVQFRGHPHVSKVAVSGVGSLCLLDPVICWKGSTSPRGNF